MEKIIHEASFQNQQRRTKLNMPDSRSIEELSIKQSSNKSINQTIKHANTILINELSNWSKYFIQEYVATSSRAFLPDTRSI